MPEIIVRIKWDETPDEPALLDADAVAIALHSCYRNIRFDVDEPESMMCSRAGMVEESEGL